MPADVRTYRRKPLTVEAVQLTADADWEAIAQWCGGKVYGKGGDRQILVPARSAYDCAEWASIGTWVVQEGGKFGVATKLEFSDFEPVDKPDDLVELQVTWRGQSFRIAGTVDLAKIPDMMRAAANEVEAQIPALSARHARADYDA